MKTLQSIKKGISLLDERRAEVPLDATDGTGVAEGGGWLASAEEFDDDAEEDASLPVQR